MEMPPGGTTRQKAGSGRELSNGFHSNTSHEEILLLLLMMMYDYDYDDDDDDDNSSNDNNDNE